MVMMTAGYDPYAAAGTLGKLSMASGQAGLLTQFEDQIGSDAHQSFNTRLDNLFTLMKLVCAQVPSVCAAYKSGYHSHLPGIAPLSKPPLNLVNR